MKRTYMAGLPIRGRNHNLVAGIAFFIIANELENITGDLSIFRRRTSNRRIARADEQNLSGRSANVKCRIVGKTDPAGHLFKKPRKYTRVG